MKHGHQGGRAAAIWLGSIVWLLSASNLARAETVGGTLRITLGQQRVLDVPAPLEQVAIGDPEVADVKIISQGRQILVTGLGRGTTDLVAWDAQGRQTTTTIQVMAKDIGLVRDEVQAVLGEVEGILIRTVGERVVVDGEVFTRQDFERIRHVCAMYPKDVTVLARMSSAITRLIASEINRCLTKNGYPDVRAEGVGGKIFLEGTVGVKEDLETVQTLSTAYFDSCVNLVRVGGKLDRLVLIDIQFVEVGKRYLEKIGLNWDDVARVQVDEVTFLRDMVRGTWEQGDAILTGADDFGVNVNLLESDALARTLAHPRLVCKSGEKAEFIAGGEIPLPLITEERILITYKSFGIILKISPIAHRDGKISASVEAESSTIDNAISVGGYPGFKKRSVETYVTLDKEKVLTLSGLVNQSDTKGVERVPLIGKLPIIGELFKSRDFSNDQSELVIFLASRLLEPEEEQDEEMIRSLEKKYDETGEALKPRLTD
ncbi:MAG: pilus assembly protein N-terminal domain-containing protein [bacterium]